MSYAYYRFFTGDYMRDTMHLGWFEDLAYRRLIDLYLLHGRPIKNDRAYIMRAVRATEPEQQGAVDTVLAEFFTLKSDGWHQARCDAEIRYRGGVQDSAHRAAQARWSRKNNKENNGQDADAMRSHSGRITNQNQNQNQNQNKPNPSRASNDARFDDFWLAYPRKKSKGTALKAWKRLIPTADLATQIMAGLNAAKSSADWQRENGRFIPYPASWLNARGWEDEVTQKLKVFPI